MPPTVQYTKSGDSRMNKALHMPGEVLPPTAVGNQCTKAAAALT